MVRILDLTWLVQVWRSSNSAPGNKWQTEQMLFANVRARSRSGFSCAQPVAGASKMTESENHHRDRLRNSRRDRRRDVSAPFVILVPDSGISSAIVFTPSGASV